jgi:5'-3' exonuclease
MGVLHYYAWLCKKHPRIFMTVDQIKAVYKIDNVCMDANGLIYGALHKLLEAGLITGVDEHSYQLIVDETVNKIEELIAVFRPTTLVYVAFDGVAPIAKQKQQRYRRYTNALISKVLGRKDIFPSHLITPGTEFMNFFSAAMEKHYENSALVQISSAFVPGEGEHKIRGYGGIICGMDADLVMLSLLEKNTRFIYRDDLQKMICIDRLKDDISRMYGLDMETYVDKCMFMGNDFVDALEDSEIISGDIDRLLRGEKIEKKKLGGYVNVNKDDEYIMDNAGMYILSERIWRNEVGEKSEYDIEEHKKALEYYKTGIMKEERDDKIKIIPEEGDGRILYRWHGKKIMSGSECKEGI